MSAVSSSQRTRRNHGGCSGGGARLVSVLLLLLTVPFVSARPCSSNVCRVSFTWSSRQRAPSSVDVDCSPQALQQVPGLLLHPAMLSGLSRYVVALRQRWQQAGAPPALISARGNCLALHVRGSSIQGPDLAALGVQAVVALNGGASLHVEGLRCGGLSEVACINATGAGGVRLVDLDVTQVTLERGSAVQVAKAQSVEMRGSSFTNCTGSEAGAVLLQGVANITIQDTTWTSNRGTGPKVPGGAGALGIRSSDRVRLGDSAFTSNTAAKAAGGAVSCNLCGQQVYERVVFLRNTALRSTGGGLYQNSSTSTTLLQDVLFEANQASSHGGGLCSHSVHPPSCVDSVADCRTVLNGCTLVGNKAGVGPYSFGGGGGGMYLEQKAAMWRALVVTNSRFLNNTAASQELSTIQSIDVDASGAGGGIGQSGQQNINSYIYNTTFERNMAAYGAGVAFIWTGGLVCFNCTFRHNNASLHGGAMFAYRLVQGSTVVTDMLAVLREVMPLPDPADHVAGGTLDPTTNSSTLPEQFVLQPGTITFQASRFEYNSAGRTGGDMHAWIPQRYLVMAACSMIGSRAGVQGGSVLLIGGVLQASGSVWQGCRAGARGGGAIHVDGADAGSLMGTYGGYTMWVELIRCALLHNSAEGSGGGLFASGVIQVMVSSSVLVNNTAEQGPGGALVVIGAELLDVRESVLRDNRALAGAGGGAACVTCSSVTVINSTLCGNRALQGGAIDLQGTPNSPAWAAVLNSTVTNNAAELPQPSRNMSVAVFGMPVQQLLLPTVDAPGSDDIPVIEQAGNPSSSSSSKVKAQTALQSSDEFDDLFGVGGGLRLVAAALLATNSSMGGNTAARLGPQVALLQGCWQAADLKETLPGSFKLMEIPQTSSRCSFAFMTSDVNMLTAPCNTSVSPNGSSTKGALRSKPTSTGGWPGVLTCPDMMPARFCGGMGDVVASCTLPSNMAYGNRSIVERPAPGLADSAAMFTSVSVVRESVNWAHIRVPPFMVNCTLNLTELSNNLQLTTRRECNIGSNVWGAGCECMQEWMYTTPAGTDHGPNQGCQPLDFTTPWCVINATTCTSTPCGTWDSCKAKGDTRSLPSRPVLKLVSQGECRRSWQLPGDSLADGAASGGCGSKSKQPSSGSRTAALVATSPGQLVLMQGEGGAVGAGAAGYQSYSGPVPPACQPHPAAAAGAGAWGGATALKVFADSYNTLPPLLVLLADGRGRPVTQQQSPAAKPVPLMVTAELVMASNTSNTFSRDGTSESAARGAGSSPGAVDGSARASVSGVSRVTYLTGGTPGVVVVKRLADGLAAAEPAPAARTSGNSGELRVQDLLHVQLGSLQVYGGPGSYWLRFADASLPTSLLAPAPACLLVEVQACVIGEVPGVSAHPSSMILEQMTSGMLGSPASSSASSSSSAAAAAAGPEARRGTCVPCEAGTFSLLPGQQYCQPCVTGGICPGGSSLVASPGWWHPSPLGPSVVPCLHPSACTAAAGPAVVLQQQQAAVAAVQQELSAWSVSTNGSTTSSRGSNSTATAGRRLLQMAGGSTTQLWDPAPFSSIQCATGHTGPLCGACQPGWVPQAGQACSQCSPQVGLLVFLQVLTFLLLLGIMLVSAQRAWVAGSHTHQTLRPQVMQVATLYLQLLGLLPVLRTSWPPAVEAILLLVSAVMYGSTGFGSNGLGLDCLMERLSHGAGVGALALPPAAVRVILKVLVVPPLTCLVALAAAAAANAIGKWLQQLWNRSRPAHLIHPTLPELQRSWASVDKGSSWDAHTLGAPYNRISRSSSSMTASGAQAWAVQSSSFSAGSSVVRPSKPSTGASSSSEQCSAAACVTGAGVDTDRDSKQPVVASTTPATFYGMTGAQMAVLVLVVLQVQYPGLVYAALSTFNCITVPLPAMHPTAALDKLWTLAGNGSGGELTAVWPGVWQLSPVKLWVLDMNQQCFTGYHARLLVPVAVVGLLVWGLGLPAATLALALAGRKRASPAATPEGSSDGDKGEPQPLEVPVDPSFGHPEESLQYTSVGDSSARMFVPTPPPSDPISCGPQSYGPEDSLGPFGMMANQQAALTSRETSGAQTPRIKAAATDITQPQTAGPPAKHEVSSSNSSWLVGAVTELPLDPSSLQPQLPQRQQLVQQQQQRQQPQPLRQVVLQQQKQLQNGNGARPVPTSSGVGKCGTVLEEAPSADVVMGTAPAPVSTRQHWAATVTTCLAASYKAATKWWPAVQLLLLFALVATAVFSAQAGSAMQPSFMMLVVLLMYAITQLVQPHRNAVQGKLVAVVLAAFGLLLYAADRLAVCSGSHTAKMSEAQLLCTLQASSVAVAAVLLMIMVVPVVAMVWAMREQLAWWCRWLAHSVQRRLPVSRHPGV